MSKVIVRNLTTGSELLWRSIKIKKSLDEICHSLELEIPPSERLKVKRHHKLEVRCKNNLVKDSDGERRVTTVLVDEVTSNADVTKHSLTVFGRSPARDIIDSTWSGDFFDPTPLEIIANDIVSPFFDARGIEKFSFQNRPHVTRIPWTDPETEFVSSFSWNNESPWTKLIDEADQKGYIFTSNEAGNLYLWRVAAGGRNEPFHITEGVNIKNINWKENGSEQFHEYIVIGGDNESVTVEDDTCPGKRTLSIFIDDISVSEDELRHRAITEMRRRKETKTIVTVPGWGLTNEQIKSLGETNGMEIYWVPNILIPVKVPTLGLNDKLLISEVEYTAAADTMSCDITLVNREMYL
jgi:prophage tail gpP-like protein